MADDFKFGQDDKTSAPKADEHGAQGKADGPAREAHEAFSEEVHEQYEEGRSAAMDEGLRAAVDADEQVKDAGQTAREHLTEAVFPGSGSEGTGPAKNQHQAGPTGGMHRGHEGE
jgi:hypothetical protein